MKKIMTVFYWLDFFCMMLIPLVLILCAKFRYYPVLDNISFLATVWLAVAVVFILFAIVLAVAIRLKTTFKDTTEAKHRAWGTFFIISLSLIGIGLVYAKEKVSVQQLWDAALIYWIVFAFFIVKMVSDFIDQCRSTRLFF